MNLWLRFIIVLLRALRRARLHPLDESVIELRGTTNGSTCSNVSCAQIR